MMHRAGTGLLPLSPGGPLSYPPYVPLDLLPQLRLLRGMRRGCRAGGQASITQRFGRDCTATAIATVRGCCQRGGTRHRRLAAGDARSV